MRVLLTRPERESAATSARLAARGHSALAAPVLRIAAVPATIPAGHWEALIATSAHAIEWLDAATLEHLRDAPLFVVGARTAAAARAANFRDVRDAYADAGALAAALLTQATPRSHFLYLAGRDRKGALEAALRAANHHVETVVVYEAQAQAALPDEAIAALRDGRIDAVLHFSQRSAALFLDLARAAGLQDALPRMLHVCISADAAAPLDAIGLPARIATRASPEAMIDALAAT